MAKALLLLFLLLAPAVLPGQRLTQEEALHFLEAVARPEDRVMPVAPTGSMYPFLDENCLTLVRRVPLQSIQNGDIVIYEEDGKLVGHRVVRRRGTRFITSGDHNRYPDTPVDAGEIRGVVVAMASFDPKSPRFPYAPVGFKATNRELLALSVTAPFTLSEARRAAQAQLAADELALTVRTTGDNLRRSEQSVLIVRKATDRIQVGDLVTLRLPLLKRFLRLFQNQKESTARRVAEINSRSATVYREGRPAELITVPRANIQGLVVGCVFFAGRDEDAGAGIYLE